MLHGPAYLLQEQCLVEHHFTPGLCALQAMHVIFFLQLHSPAQPGVVFVDVLVFH